MTPTEPLYFAILIPTGAFTGVISGLLGGVSFVYVSCPVLAFAGNRTAT